MIYCSNRGARNTGKAVLNLGLSITEPNCMEPSRISLPLSLWNRNRRSYVSRISTTSDFQSSYASNPRSLIESTPQTSIFEFVSLPPLIPVNDRTNTQFLCTSTVSFRNSIPFRESRSRRIYESISDSILEIVALFNRSISRIVFFFRFSPFPSIESKESKSFGSRNRSKWKCLRAVSRNKSSPHAPVSTKGG